MDPIWENGNEGVTYVRVKVARDLRGETIPPDGGALL